MRGTLVVKYIDLDREILPKKQGEKKEMQTKIRTSNGQFIVVWWPTTYSSHFSCFHLNKGKSLAQINDNSLPSFS